MPGTGTITEDSPSTLQELTLSSLQPHPKNRPSGLGDLEDLTESIKASGILQPLVVIPATAKGKYRIIAGHRRHAAAKAANMGRVPCIVRTDLDDEADQLAAMINENGAREGLTVLDEAAAFQGLLDLGDSIKSASARTGMSQRRVRDRVKIAGAPESVKARVVEHQISLDEAVFIASHYDDQQDRALIDSYLGTSNWEWAKTRLRELAASRKKIAAIRKAAEKAGVPIVETIKDRDRLIDASEHKGVYISDAYPVPGRDIAAENTIIEITPGSHEGAVPMVRVFELVAREPEPEPAADAADAPAPQSGAQPIPEISDRASARLAAQEENKRIHSDLLTAAAVRRQFLTAQADSNDTAGAVLILKATIREMVEPQWAGATEMDLQVLGIHADAGGPYTPALLEWIDKIDDLPRLAWVVAVLHWISAEHPALARERDFAATNPYTLDPEDAVAPRLITTLSELGYQWSDIEQELIEKAAADADSEE